MGRVAGSRPRPARDPFATSAPRSASSRSWRSSTTTTTRTRPRRRVTSPIRRRRAAPLTCALIGRPLVQHPQDLARERPDQLVARRPPRVLGVGVALQEPRQPRPVRAQRAAPGVGAVVGVGIDAGRLTSLLGHPGTPGGQGGLGPDHRGCGRPDRAAQTRLLSFTDEGDTPSSPLPASLPATGVTSTLKVNNGSPVLG
jgi:hypothetical protein